MNCTKINRLRKSPVQRGYCYIYDTKLFAVLTGQALSDDNEDTEMKMQKGRKNLKKWCELGSDLKLSSDYFSANRCR